MKYIFQFSIIILISCIGEIIKALVPLPIPASIYGLVIMFIGLCTGIIKLEKVEAVSDFLLEIMPLAFIPGGVGLITAWAELKGMLVSALVIIVVTNILVMAVTGHIAQILIGRKEKKNDR